MTISNTLIIFSLLLSVSYAQRQFTFTNYCNVTVYVGALDNPGFQLPMGGGWALTPGDSNIISLQDNWQGRFWGRTDCDFDSNGNGYCQTGDCGGVLQCNGAGGNPPATLIEMTLSGNGNQDYYDVSLVDGYNLPVAFGPDAPTSNDYNCTLAGCVSDLNDICPSDLQVVYNGQVVACLSACEKYGSPQYCCTGAYSTPQTCQPTTYSEIFKKACPNAYSYAYDDHTSTFTCPGQYNYNVIFCP
ncbi:hypothetical protein SAMD00019534_120730 [Acytostelium subglobosum LB1]|uniref:hypothetical protein n=1 Tax=Acytostelium subglobosum LB1 TaxID=1410327 RepID=UPI00064494ED|nr:hypothetical protein SAMD00019534_120730 [Acytostelium subglobosum LB1]GAM28897.1 hypothetical protein SAMD00019534_120730 [Acytostelium subglobosum LB1]|eukprot:XP_012748082.1 hypothetical protein SAMD00019534_120730 [Acytostelium subglobosum LB1]